MGDLGIMCSLRDQMFSGSNPVDVDAFLSRLESSKYKLSGSVCSANLELRPRLLKKLRLGEVGL